MSGYMNMPHVKAYYMTLDEYMDMVRTAVQDVYKVGDTACHPSDLYANVVSVMETIESSMAFLLDRNRSQAKYS